MADGYSAVSWSNTFTGLGFTPEKKGSQSYSFIQQRYKKENHPDGNIYYLLVHNYALKRKDIEAVKVSKIAKIKNKTSERQFKETTKHRACHWNRRKLLPLQTSKKWEQ